MFEAQNLKPCCADYAEDAIILNSANHRTIHYNTELYAKIHNAKQESPADARVTRDSSACTPQSWIFEI